MRIRSGSKSMRIQCVLSNLGWICIEFGLKSQCEQALKCQWGPLIRYLLTYYFGRLHVFGGSHTTAKMTVTMIFTVWNVTADNRSHLHSNTKRKWQTLKLLHLLLLWITLYSNLFNASFKPSFLWCLHWFMHTYVLHNLRRRKWSNSVHFWNEAALVYNLKWPVKIHTAVCNKTVVHCIV